MGQPVTVIVTPTARRGVVRLEANRTLTGQGHERFRSLDDAVGPRPAASLARQLLGTGHVESVHVYANIVTVDLHKGGSADEVAAVVRDMYQYWKPGMEPPAFADPVPEEAPAAGADAGAPGGAPGAGGGAAGGADAEYHRRVPANLVERSAAALSKWKAGH